MVPSDAIGIVGEGWTARLLAITTAVTGRHVYLCTPEFHPDMLPRPMPARDDAVWEPVWRNTAFAVEPQVAWREYGGRIAEPLRRRVVAEADQASAVGIDADGPCVVAADAAWRWSEPRQGWTELWQLLLRRMAGLPITVVPLAQWPPVLTGGIFKRAHFAGLPSARRWVFVAPPVGGGCAWTVGEARHRVRCGIDERGAWCRVGDLTWWHGDVALNVDMGPQVGALPSALPWGIADCRGFCVLQLPHPALAPPSQWAARLAEARRWLTRTERVCGKA